MRGLLQDCNALMPTLDALKTAVADFERAQVAFAEVMARHDAVTGQMATIQNQIATAKANLAANEEALRTVAGQFATAATQARLGGK